MFDDAAKAADRRFMLLTKLMGGGKPKASDLARDFGVTERTIFRDVDFLERNRVPVVRENGRYSVEENYKLRPVQLQPDEVLALMAALDFGRRKGPLGGKAAASAQEKLLAVLPTTQKELAAGLTEIMVVDPVQAYSKPPAPGVEESLRTAIGDRHPVRLVYQALDADQPGERVVEPYGLAYRGTALYLIGFCRLRQGIRIFRANRILSIAMLASTFQRPADFDLEAYLSGIWGIEFGPQMQVRVRFDRHVARLARETVWHPSQRLVDEADGAVILEMETRGTNELARWLAGYGGTVEVLDPPELREAVLALGRAIVERYGG